jgi:hypothetical protein
MKLLEESRVIQDGLGARDRLARVLSDLGLSARLAGKPRLALDAHRDSLVIFHELGNRAGIVDCLEGIAWVSHDSGDAARAVRLLGAAATLRPSTMSSLAEVPDDPVIAELRGALAEDDCVAAWVEGRAMTIEQAVAYAVDDPDPA